MPHFEEEPNISSSTLNWLRAAVLGANDGIVSVASIVVGVAAASNLPGFILTAGTAGLIAGALSMAVGEYVSVSTQRDSERALLRRERRQLREHPKQELEELAGLYEQKGISRETALQVAKELTAHDALTAHMEAELHMHSSDFANPLHAASASALSFLCGGVLPLLAIMLAPTSLRIPFTVVAVLVALVITGVLSAHAGGASKRNATLRIVIGGFLAMAITYGIGTLFGISGI